MPLKPIRVLVITASSKLRQKLVNPLAFVPRVAVVGVAASGEEALTVVAGGAEPNVVLLDLMIPGMGGIATIHALRDKLLNSEIIALVSLLRGATGEEAIRAGAVGFLPTYTLKSDMVYRAVFFAHNGMRFRVEPEETPPVPIPTYPVPAFGQELTNRERELLGLLVRGLPTARIAEWLVITPATIKFHMRNIRSKLGTRSRAETIAYAVANQLVPDE
jgi:DNA-binding NarL/FixJ family response regulator